MSVSEVLTTLEQWIFPHSDWCCHLLNQSHLLHWDAVSSACWRFWWRIWRWGRLLSLCHRYLQLCNGMFYHTLPHRFHTCNLCKCHIHLHSRPHLCRTRRIIPVRTWLRASQTQCDSNVPLCLPHRPGNNRSHPALSVCSAASSRTGPHCTAQGSSPRTWHLLPKRQHYALWIWRILWKGENTSLGKI